jgi:signal recognition particle subunit SRP54
MFENLTDRLQSFVKHVSGQGRLSPENLRESLSDVRRALLEADVSVGVVKDLLERVEARATGQEVLQSLTPGQQVVRVVHEELARLLGGRAAQLAEAPRFPTVVMALGLQGSGKTTFCAKLARWLAGRKRRALLASADVYRPAAITQLRQLATAHELPFFAAPEGTTPEEIARSSRAEARRRGFDYLVFDTAGRLHVDAEMMEEAKRLKRTLEPHQALLVVDGMSGRDAVQVAEAFCREVGVHGLVLTKMDGDARGGAALAIRAVTGTPVLFLGTGEKLDGLEIFHPERLASRILGMGDVLTLVERAQERVDAAQAEQAARKLARAEFTLEDFLAQMREVRKLGSLGEILKLVPGAPRVSAEDVAGGERQMRRAEAILQSMTPAERRRPEILNGSRRRRIAAGSGTRVEDVNRLVRDFEAMRKLLRQAGGRKGGKGGGLSRLGLPRP